MRARTLLVAFASLSAAGAFAALPSGASDARQELAIQLAGDLEQPAARTAGEAVLPFAGRAVLTGAIEAETTDVHSFALNGGSPSYVASGTVDDWQLEQFEVEELGADTALRCAVTEISASGSGSGTCTVHGAMEGSGTWAGSLLLPSGEVLGSVDLRVDLAGICRRCPAR